MNVYDAERMASVLAPIGYELTETSEDADLFILYQKQGGIDSEGDFKLKWSSGEIEIGNVRELREFKIKLKRLKK